jgi:hypothetical protein
MLAGYKEFRIDRYTSIHPACGFAVALVNFILCHNSEAAHVGTICFYPKGQVPMSNVVYVPAFRFMLNYEIDRYQEIIETFRYEKPVFVHISWDDNNTITYGIVTTSQEPIGKQEGVPGMPT